MKFELFGYIIHTSHATSGYWLNLGKVESTTYYFMVGQLRRGSLVATQIVIGKLKIVIGKIR